MIPVKAAFFLYLVLGAIAVATLRGDYRTGTLILLGALAAKTWVGHQKQMSNVPDSEGGSIVDPDSRKSMEPKDQ